MRPFASTLLLAALTSCAAGKPAVQAAATPADWCAGHGVPESQCTICHPDLKEPAPQPPANADVAFLNKQGEDVPALEPAAGKVTIFDFYADWCGPCRKVDRHVYALLETRDDVAVRKLDVGSWDTPLAKRHLAKVPELPYLLVYGRDGTLVRAISGLDLPALDAAIAEGAKR